MSRVRRRRWLVAVALVAALVAATVLAFDVRTVSTGSMEPTLWGRGPSGRSGDLLLIERFAYWFSDPERFDIVVFRAEADESLRTKRIHGLPGETVQVIGGDLYVEERIYRKSEIEWNRCAVLLFDSAEHPYQGEQGFWTRAQGSESSERPSTTSGSRQEWTSRRIRSDYRTDLGAWHAGAFDVLDAEIEVQVACPQGKGALAIRWAREDRAIAEARLERSDEEASARLSFRLSEQQELLWSQCFPWPRGATAALVLRRLDGSWKLECELAGRREERSWELLEASPGELARAWNGGATIGLELSGDDFALDSCRVRRDLHHVDPSRVEGASPPQKVGPDHFFVLGDHSEDSRDSLSDGDVARQALIGRVAAILGPGGRRRWIR